MHTLHEFLEYMASRYGTADTYAWIDGETIVSKSFIDLKNDAELTAAELFHRFGTQKKMALIGDMSYSWICVYYGIIISGNVCVPLDTKLNPSEVAEHLDFADVTEVFLSEKYGFLKETILKRCEKAEAVFRLEDYPGGISTRQQGCAFSDDPDALASLMFTSGTSGDGLKAAMITQRGILADVTGPVPLCVPGDRLLSLLPIHHCFEIFVGQMKYQYLGGAICINDSMANLIPNLTRFGITIVVAVPALANMLAALISRQLKTHTIDEVKKMLGGKLRRITIGGASASKEVIETLGLAGITVFVGYGLTESTGGCLANCDASIRPREAGAPYVKGMEMKLDDGELCLLGPMIMQGYYKAPELTAKVMENGWFHTGDLAEITDEGYVIIHGRKDNMIKTPNGEKIYPENWENKLSKIVEVSAAMVTEIDRHLTAILFLREDSPENRETVAKAIDAINTGLPAYEKILDVRFRKEPFPMTTSMKIKRREVMKEMSKANPAASGTGAQNAGQQQIMDKVMQVLPGDCPVGIDDNLYEMGLDSLSTINLALLLDCAPDVIYACKTIRCLSEKLNAADAAGQQTSGDERKVRDINRYIEVSPGVFPGLGKVVLLTGASGFLGAHVLAELVKTDHRVICLVRSRESLERACTYYGFSDAAGSVETVVGDIVNENLGLNEEQFETLCRKTDSVIHCAALVSHVGSEEASFRVNVGGTQEIIRFCKKSGAPLFHISTYAVAGFGTAAPLTEDVLDIGQKITGNPYIQTKYQAEELILQAREQGVASTIFRMGNLTERFSDGVFQINAASNGMAAQIRAFRKLGIYPESMREVPYDATAVDKAASAVVLLAEEKGTGNIWHIMNPHVKYLPQLTNAQMVPDTEFTARLSEEREDRDTAILSVYYRMANAGFDTHFDSSRTNSVLEGLGFTWP